MVEISLVIILIVAIAKIAIADDKSPIIWGSVALGMCVLCVNLIHFPYARILLSGFLTFGAMIGYNVVAHK
jgi:hypothetical protein